jgi:ribosomal protein L37E
MVDCPRCGREQETKNKYCSNCQYAFRYDDLADYSADDLAFTVTFDCRNCGETIKLGFASGDQVEPAGARRNFSGINEVTGNQYLAKIDGYPCLLQCPTCESDTSLFVSEKSPIRERSSGDRVKD